MNKKNLIFYDIMNYDVPIEKTKFHLFDKSIETKASQNLLNIEKYSNYCKNKGFSYKKKNKYLSDFIDFINKYGFLYRSLPFVKAIYLCNSITFNSLNKESDIDLFIICKKNRIWLARFFSLLLFQIIGIRRYRSKIYKRFCLSFYVSEDSLDLYLLTIKPFDIYFAYWFAHLCPLYLEDINIENNIFESNPWINNYIPNFPMKTSIYLENKIFFGSNYFKKVIEFIFFSIIGHFFEFLIKVIWLPILIQKSKKLGSKANDGVFISDNILKFYGNDIRKKVNLKFKMLNN